MAITGNHLRLENTFYRTANAHVWLKKKKKNIKNKVYRLEINFSSISFFFPKNVYSDELFLIQNRQHFSIEMLNLWMSQYIYLRQVGNVHQLWSLASSPTASFNYDPRRAIKFSRRAERFYSRLCLNSLTHREHDAEEDHLHFKVFSHKINSIMD